MTKYGWDTSNHDWGRGPMDLARARSEGISIFTAKSSEGNTYLDPNFANAMARARSVDFPVLGPYHVLWPLNPVSQADDWFAKVDQNAPWWREHPCWIWQIDAELFQNFSPYRQPTVAEINACGDRIVVNAACKPTQVVVYAPEWLYNGGLGGLKYRNLWASSYVPGSGGFKALYPGDTSTRWHAYSGIDPVILQYTSSATIAGQAPADANGIRVATDADLQAIFLGGGDPPMPLDQTDLANIKDQCLAAVRQVFVLRSNMNVAVFGTSVNDDYFKNLYTLASAIQGDTNDLQAKLVGVSQALTGIQASLVDLAAQGTANGEQLTAVSGKVDQVLEDIANLQLGGPVKYTLTATGELTPESPTPPSSGAANVSH